MSQCGFCSVNAQYLCVRNDIPLCVTHARLAVIMPSPSQEIHVLSVRPAEAGDYEGIRQLAEYFWQETEMFCFGRTYDVLALPALVAFRDQALAGCLSYSIEGSELVIVMLNVLPEHQRSGLGGKLVSWVVDLAKAKNLSRVVVATSNDDLPAIYFYQRRGFRLSQVAADAIARHHGGLEPGFAGIPVRDEVRMTLELGPS
ncbi:MAG: GNAT family N-acetyltransferase [Chloroflexota bacterium]